MAHRELAVALWEGEIAVCIPGTSLCSLLCLHPALANTGVDEHSTVLWWLIGGPGGVFEDTPHEGRTVLQFWDPSRADPHL